MYNFSGCYTAIITPFKNEQIDFNALGELIEEQIEGGVDGIVAVGTTGESPTLDHDEHDQVIRFIIKQVASRCKVIAGTGANSTSEAIRLTKAAEKAGADGSLQVTPYYNKPTQEGLYLHFKAVADATTMPIVLYNVPGRSGVPIAVDIVARLFNECPNIVSVKEAAGCVDRVNQLKNACDIEILSGDDALTLPMMSVGAIGVISVISNVLPKETTQKVHKALKGDFAGALEIHYKLYKLMSTLFIESNPIPVKTALAAMGKVEEEFRLPMSTIATSNKEILLQVMRETGIDV